MTALAKARQSTREHWAYHLMTLATGHIAYPNAALGIDLSTGKVEPMHAEGDLLFIGKSAETAAVDATSADKQVNVRFDREIEGEWWENSGTNAVAATDVGSICYFEDDQTVGMNPNTFSVAGRVWAVDASLGVFVERLQAPSGAARLEETTATAYASNDSIIAANPPNNAIYDVPTTGAASTVTLPAAAREGTIIYFMADGTKNGHTVQYRDATGPVNLTTALTASKRHLVVCTYLNAKWAANAYIAP